MNVLPVCLSVYLKHAWSLLRLGEGIRSLGPGVQLSAAVGAGKVIQVLGRAAVGPSPQPPSSGFFFFQGFCT